MLTSAFEAMLNQARGLQVVDLIDIALVTIFVYSAVVLVRRTHARLVAIGIVFMGALYIAARSFDLRLTSWLLQGFFAVFLVIVVVIFQEELRQLFERLALWGLRRRAAPQARAPSLPAPAPGR
jgi:diadenylate cyclase